jgi:hypothetical protein
VSKIIKSVVETYNGLAKAGVITLTGRRIAIPGYRVNKDGKLVKRPAKMDVSKRLRQRSSKRVRVGKRISNP